MTPLNGMIGTGMSIFETLAGPRTAAFVKDQNLQDLLAKREFRLTDKYLHEQFISGMDDEEVRELELRFYDGCGEISGKVKKRLLPVTIPFSFRFSLNDLIFTRDERAAYLKVEEVRPLDLDWVTRRVVEKVPFLSWSDGMVVCRLDQVPGLASLMEARVKGMKVVDFVTLRDVRLQEGELIGRVGVAL